MASHGGPDIVSDGIVLCLDAGNTKSYPDTGSTWYDLLGSINGTIDGATFDNGIFDFDGTNDKVTIPDSTDFEFGSGDFTVEAWINQSNAAGSGDTAHTIVNKWHNTSNAKEWILRIDNGTGSNKLQWLQTTDGTNNQILTGNTVINTGTWYHVAVVGDSGTIKLFVNGTQQSSTLSQGTIHAHSNELILGYNKSTPGQWMDGKIALVRVYKGKGLTATEVTQNYNALNLRVESWVTETLPLYKTTFCAQINYNTDDDPSYEKTSFLVTNDDFANVTVFDNKAYIQGSGTQNPCFTTDTIYQHGYWGDFKAIQFDPTITFSTPTTTNTDPQSFAWDPNYSDNLFGVRWSGSMRYTTDKSSPTWLDSTLENSAGVTTSASGYNFGAGYLKDVGIIAVKHLSDPDILRLYKSTDGGVNFTEYQVANWTSWAGQSGAYADFDGGKFMIWGSVNSTNSCVSSSDGVNWSVASTSGNIPMGNYRGFLPAVYNKHTSKFYTAERSTSIGISTDGLTWTTDTVSNTTYNVVPLNNGDMVGMHIDGSDAKFTKYPRSGTTVDWSNPTLIKTVGIATNFGSLKSSELGLYGPYPFQ